MRRLSVALGLVAASLSALRSLSLSEDVEWFTTSPSSNREAWNAVDPPSVCALDVFHFEVEFRYKVQAAFNWQLIVKSVEGYENGAVVASGPLKVTISSRENVNKEDIPKEESYVAEERDEGLKCEFDSDFCIPKLVGIRLPDVDGESEDGTLLRKDHTVELTFGQPTNRPDARIKENIDRFVVFTEYIGDEFEGRWSSDGRVLEIQIMQIDEHKVKPMGELMQGLLQTSIVVTGGDKRSDRGVDEVALYEGVQSLRVEPPGTYAVRVFFIGGAVVYWSPEVYVQPCEDSYVVVDPNHATALSDMDLPNEIVSDTTSSFEIDGVLTHGGDEGFGLRHDSIQMEKPGSWSLSFWVLLTEDSTGSFRTLFFNGDGERQQRTPSAWWKPDERRLVLRVSTEANADVGLDSNGELPLNQWVHMGFTFVNCSQSDGIVDTQLPGACPHNQSDMENWLYSYSFYVNGILDTEVRIHEPVVANAGPLHIGKGPWTDGMQGFTSNLKVFSVPISSDEQRKIYFSERHLHKNFDDCGDNAYYDTEMQAPSMQISYLSQCFDCGRSNIVDLKNMYDDGDDGSDSPMSFDDIQATAFDKAVLASDSCKEDVWDLLVEAAELGYPAASCAVGEAYLYGSYSPQNGCPAVVPIQQNLTLADHFLDKAFCDGVYRAGKCLALLFAVSDNTGFSSGTRLATGLIHFAAVSGEKDAFAMLGRKYSQAAASVEIATYHYYHAAVEAAIQFHKRGKQPLHEMTRLYDSFERDITVGERGDDDELIQFQKLRASEGDVEAMAAMGDLYYWGVHGVPRDHAQAYNYFNQAAHAGNVNSQSAVAGMLLKREGTAQDNATAIKWYEKAAEKNHTRALNGLGFMHFQGSGGVPENKSLALEYFERAAENEEDGDSVFNAGYCHAMGLGTNVNVTHAMAFYNVAARKFGHFDAIFEMGKILMHGVPGVVLRNSEQALGYLKEASDGGQWGCTVRKGFDLYTNGEFERAIVLYHEARELGYPVAVSNLAFLYDQRLLEPGDIASERRALKYLILANKKNGDRETLVRIGDYHYYGLAGLPKDPRTAIRWYSRASAEGAAVGAYNVGHMYEFGDGVEMNLERAQRYYDRVVELSTGATETQFAIRFALTRLSLRRWLRNTPFERILGLKSPLATNTDTNASTAAIFEATTSSFDGNFYVIISTTTTIIVISIGVWYFHST